VAEVTPEEQQRVKAEATLQRQRLREASDVIVLDGFGKKQTKSKLVKPTKGRKVKG
jgi:hypothetical protein